MAGQVANFLGRSVANTISVANFMVANVVATYVKAAVARGPLKEYCQPIASIVTVGFVLTAIQDIESYVYDNYLRPHFVYLLGNADSADACPQ